MAAEMIERVAKALYVNSGLTYSNERYWQDLAKIAIAAMREPTKEMLDGARDWSVAKNGKGVGNDQATGCWQAMIDAALKEDISDVMRQLSSPL